MIHEEQQLIVLNDILKYDIVQFEIQVMFF